jgi:hypothetical protein
MSISENIVKLNLFPRREMVTRRDTQFDSDEEQVLREYLTSKNPADTALLLNSILHYYRCDAAAD